MSESGSARAPLDPLFVRVLDEAIRAWRVGMTAGMFFAAPLRRVCASMTALTCVALASTMAAAAEPKHQAPVFQPLGVKVVPEGARIEQPISVTEPDGRLLPCEAERLPQGASFVDHTFIWPSAGPAGTYQIVFTVEDDGRRYASEPLVIRVVRPASELAPVLNLSAQPALIATGEAATLSWFTTNLKSCRASGGWTGNKSARGKETLHPEHTTTYTLVCSADQWSLIKRVTITVDPSRRPRKSIVTLHVNPDAAAPGQTMTIRWVASDGLVERMDWIGLFATGAPNHQATWRHYTHGEQQGRFTMRAPSQPGDYELRYIQNASSISALAIRPVSVTEEP